MSSDCLVSVLFCDGFYGGTVWAAGTGYVSAVQTSCGFPCVLQGMPSESWLSLHGGESGPRTNRRTLSVVFPCTPDPAGNEYDLSALSMVRKPWTAVDTSVHGKKRRFYLSVCTPLPYIPGCDGASVPCCAASLESD